MKKGRILLLVLLLTIGFAAVSTTFIINGTTNIGFNELDFNSNVVFTKAETLTGTAVINGDEKNIDFESIKLENINQTTALDYSVTNKSKEYDASVEIKCGLKEKYKSYEDYLDINMSLTSPFELIAGETKNGTLTVKLKKAFNESLETSVEIKCELIATPIGRDTLGEEYKEVYQDPVLNGADPVLKDELIPVTLANDGTVTYADVYNEWYNYTNKEWANAVILNDGITHEVGDTIPESDIESYFVWIPRYRYQIFDEGNYTTHIGNAKPAESIAHTINIEFENKDVDSSNGKVKDAWLTHPAFTNFDVNGIWIGKFEISNNGTTIQVKPNLPAWINVNIKTFFTTMKSYNTNLDSHMLKNTEWGAAAYLSHSVYGINGEIRINNNFDHITGYSSVNAPTCHTASSTSCNQFGTDLSITQPYNTIIGYKASTTGNITGIYDMSGGASEYVAGYIDGSPGDSGFTVDELNSESKYFDKYASNSSLTSFSNRILGDATGEMGPFYQYYDDDGGLRYHNNWYSDYSYFVFPSEPWFHRGVESHFGVTASQFACHHLTGGAHYSTSSRLVLAPTN